MTTHHRSSALSMVQEEVPADRSCYAILKEEDASGMEDDEEPDDVDNLLLAQHHQAPEMVEIPRMKKIHRSHSVEFKLHVLALAKEIGVRPAAKLYAISRKSITEWRAKEEKLLQLGEIKSLSTAKRLLGGGRKVTDTELEERMLRWVSLQKCQGNSVSPKRLIDEAMAISREIHGDANQFKASNGWCWRFCRRNNLALDNMNSFHRLNFDKSFPASASQSTTAAARNNDESRATLSSIKAATSASSSVGVELGGGARGNDLGSQLLEYLDRQRFTPQQLWETIAPPTSTSSASSSTVFAQQHENGPPVLAREFATTTSRNNHQHYNMPQFFCSGLSPGAQGGQSSSKMSINGSMPAILRKSANSGSARNAQQGPVTCIVQEKGEITNMFATHSESGSARYHPGLSPNKTASTNGGGLMTMMVEDRSHSSGERPPKLEPPFDDVFEAVVADELEQDGVMVADHQQERPGFSSRDPDCAGSSSAATINENDEYNLFGTAIAHRLRLLSAKNRPSYLNLKKKFEDDLFWAETELEDAKFECS